MRLCAGVLGTEAGALSWIDEVQPEPVPDSGASDGASTQPRHVARYPTWAIVGLSLVTLGWLLVQGLAALRQTDRTYPVTSYTMFSQPTDGSSGDWILQASMVGSSSVERVDASDLGLTELQFHRYLARNLLADRDTPHMRAEERLGRLGAIWAERNGGELDHLSVLREVRERGSSEVRHWEVASWPG